MKCCRGILNSPQKGQRYITIKREIGDLLSRRGIKYTSYVTISRQSDLATN